jgi:hypothetical protein
LQAYNNVATKAKSKNLIIRFISDAKVIESVFKLF